MGVARHPDADSARSGSQRARPPAPGCDDDPLDQRFERGRGLGVIPPSGSRPAGIDREQLARYLTSVLGATVEILDLRPLKPKSDGAHDPKGFGYGVPFKVGRTAGSVQRSLV